MVPEHGHHPVAERVGRANHHDTPSYLYRSQPPCPDPRAGAEIAPRTDGQETRALRTNHHQRERADEQRVPIEGLEQGQLEVAVAAERHPADNIAERHAEHERERRRSETEDRIAGLMPQRMLDLMAELERQPAPDQQPQHDDETEVEPAEAARVNLRERHEEHAA